MRPEDCSFSYSTAQERQGRLLGVVQIYPMMATEYQNRPYARKPHVIAEAQVKKVVGLPCLKNFDGPALVEFNRHFDTADRNLSGMGAKYLSHLNHMNTLRELARKVLRGRWTECAEKFIGLGMRFKFQYFAIFVKERERVGRQ